MYLELNLGDLYFFKVVVDGRLVEQTDNVDNQPLDEEKKTMFSPKEPVLTNKVFREV